MSDTRLKIISKNIHDLMGDMTSSELSRKSGIVYSTLLPLIKGERDFGVSKLLCIAEALGADINEILKGTYTINDEISSKPSALKYLVVFLTSNRHTRCTVFNLETKKRDSALFPFPIFCTDNPHNTIDIFKECIKQMLKNKTPFFDEIAVYSSTLSYEHITGRERLLNQGKKNFNAFILEPDWKTAYSALFPENNGILLTINDGYVISYSVDKGKNIYKRQGYSYPISDEAGSVCLGCQAIKHTINVVEGLEKRTLLSDSVLATCNSDLNRLATTLVDNTRDTYVEMASIVLLLAHRKQKSHRLIQETFNNIWEHIEALDNSLNRKLPIKISGEVAHAYEEFIPKARFAGSDFQYEEASFNYALDKLRLLLRLKFV